MKFDSYVLVIYSDFLISWTAWDRGSDAGRQPPPVCGNPERPEAYDRGSDVGRHVAGPCVDTPRGR